MKFYVSLEIFLEPFLVSTHISNSILTEWVYRNCPISIFSFFFTLVDIVKLDTKKKLQRLKIGGGGRGEILIIFSHLLRDP